MTPTPPLPRSVPPIPDSNKSRRGIGELTDAPRFPEIPRFGEVREIREGRQKPVPRAA
jgi:hypothetical protein